MKRILYISPHLDDAALSCASTIAESRDEIFVATVFTESRDSARRKREDRAAFGARAIHLGFEDAPERLDIEPSFESLCLLPELDRGLVKRVHAALGTIDHDELWMPLGVGGHIDHRTVFAAAPPHANFYEELPYAEVPALRQQERFTRAQVAEQVRAAMPALIPESCFEAIANLPLRTFSGQLSETRRELTSKARALIDAYESQRAFAFPSGKPRTERRWKVAGARLGPEGHDSSPPPTHRH